MGGRGTFAIGKKVDYTYRTVGEIEGVKVLEGIGNIHKLPEESHTSNAYIRLDRNGKFYQYREYDKNHYLKFEIGYHREPNILKSGKPVFHVHEYSPNMSDRTTRAISKKEYEKYKKYFKGVKLWKMEI